jgi:hypothetical protein
MIEEPTGGHKQLCLAGHKCKTNRNDWYLTRSRWSINTFNNLYQQDEMELYLQHRMEYLTSPFCSTFITHLALVYIPAAWIEVKMAFIPRTGHVN